MMIAPLKWSVHNPYFNYFKPEKFYVNNNTDDAKSRPLDTYLPDDYIKYKTVTFGSVGFAGKDYHSKSMHYYSRYCVEKTGCLNCHGRNF